tara:strand:+ start:1941 stop:2621 length:681 start_codon:yes stop_codon:yes gene_type:complete
MKKIILRYILEFIVIVVGISLSFYFEKQNAISYKEDLKNQSLKRILKNIEVDIKDYKFNIAAHKMAIKSADWLYNKSSNLSSQSKDSIGYHYGIATTVNTFFVDNQEEYRGLQNSGLIELIENDLVVIGLQNKYTQHNFLKQLEEYIMDMKNPLFDFLFKNTKLLSKKTNDLGLVYDRTFTGLGFPNDILERINESITWHIFYLNLVLSQKEKDERLIELIKTEIN